jgi:hypothetical protein
VEQLSPEALLQLAQYQPCRDGSTKDATFEHMVPAVLMESGGSLRGPDELRSAFLALFGVEIEQTEVETWLESLKRRGVVERDAESISVTVSTRGQLESRRREFEELVDSAADEWCTSLLRADPTLSDEDLELLWSDLDSLIGVMVAYHGAEAAVILYPEEPRSEVLRETLHRQTQVLPDRGSRLSKLRREGLAQFFSAPTESQRRYLADRLDHGFFATVGTLRPSAAVVMRDELSGQRLYLDTNVLIPALGVAGRRVGMPARRLLELTRGLGVQLAVTSRTLAEYQHSLKHAYDDLRKELPARGFANFMRNEARLFGGMSLAEGYFESYELTGAEPSDWFRKAGLVEPVLEELEIEVVDDELKAVIKDETGRIGEYVKLLAREAVRWRKDRDELPMRHDVIHRVLIERLRNGPQRDFRSAKYWFLTEDKLLPNFGHLALPGEEAPEIPFCMSASAWAQIARCFTPRTADYDQMVTDLLASPYISFGRSGSFREVQQVVKRITTLLEDASPTVVAAFVGDEVLEAVAGAKGQEEKDEVMVEAYERKKDELSENLDVLAVRVEEMQAQLEVSQAEAKDLRRLRERLSAAEAMLEQEQADRQRERALGEDEIRTLKRQRDDDREAHAHERDEASKRERLERQKRTRVGMFAVSVLAVAILVGLKLAERISLGVLVLGAGLVLALLFAPAIENPRWAIRIGYGLGIIGVLLGMAQLIYA